VIVYLLRELSKQFPKELWIRVIDHDGEFLLIEGVAKLMRALDGPELGANKVCIPSVIYLRLLLRVYRSG
jgi:hypothetical protein